jgi:hypothetical protein
MKRFALAVPFAALAWRLQTVWPAARSAAPADQCDDALSLRWFTALLATYSLEGVGYIVAGTLLVAAIDQTAPNWVGTGAWVLVGLAALPSSALWAWLSRTWSRPALLSTALILQVIGMRFPSSRVASLRHWCQRPCSAPPPWAAARSSWRSAHTCRYRARSRS